MSLMVDWITALVPFPHSEPINSGNLVSIDPEGNIEWTVEKRVTVEGSFGSSVQIRSMHKDGYCSHVRFDGNPVKWLQGHNVWGSGDLHGLLTACLERILPTIVPDCCLDILPIYTYCATLSRVDVTGMYQLDNQMAVSAWIRAAADSANMSHRGRGQFAGDTLYFGKNSRRWSLKLYSKGAELKVHKPKKGISDHPQYLKSVTDYAAKALRCELVFRQLQLVDMRLDSVQYWNDVTMLDVYNSYLSKLSFSENMKASIEIRNLDKLPPRYRTVALAWSEGHDLKAIYPRRTWYRYRNEILAIIGLDIALHPPREREKSNVVPLIRVLEAKPMPVPEWAVGTPLYFEPPVYWLPAIA